MENIEFRKYIVRRVTILGIAFVILCGVLGLHITSKEEKFVDIHKLIEDLSPNSPSVQYDVNRSIEYLR